MNHSKIRLSDHFTYKKLFLFTLPSIVMMIFTSIYGVVDGIFVSNFIGTSAFSAINLIWPFIMILGAFGFMFGAGGSALVSKTLGEGDKEKANRIFSFLTYFSFALGIVIAVLGYIFLPNIAELLVTKSEENREILIKHCTTYGRILLIALPVYMLQMEFQSFFVTAEKPTLGLIVTVISGLTNMILDALFIAVFKWGVIGAAWATAASQIVGGIIPLFYFFGKNKSLLRLGKARFDLKALWKTCTNGSSELMANVSMPLVGMLYNWQLMRIEGEEGVAAYGVLMYVCMIFLAIFIGYSVGSAPIVGFHYGAQHHDELKNILKKSLILIGVSSVCMCLLSEALAVPLSLLFDGGNARVYELTRRGFLIYSFSYLFAGFAIYGSSFFTALNDGVTSAIISFLRTLVFQVAAVLLLPYLMGMDGIWLSVILAEFMAVACTFLFLLIKRKKYKY